MHRLLIPTLLSIGPALLAACDDTEPQAPQPATQGETRVPPSAPKMGLANIQEREDELAEEIADLERQEQPDPRIVQNVLKGIDHLILALDLSIAAEARQSLEASYARLYAERAALMDENNVLTTELRNIEAMLAGTEEIPEGFTRTELQDKLGDVRTKLEELKSKREAVQARMVEKKAQLDNDDAPVPEDSLAVREREALRELRKRAEALTDR
jgi:uncharacterized phage infection (PIP) family protein YhgE